LDLKCKIDSCSRHPLLKIVEVDDMHVCLKKIMSLEGTFLLHYLADSVFFF
jgi:hypothetical protein